MCIHYIAHERYNADIRVAIWLYLQMLILYKWDNLYVYICLHASIYQVIYTQTHYLRRVCVEEGYLPICTSVQSVSPFKALSNAEYSALL